MRATSIQAAMRSRVPARSARADAAHRPIRRQTPAPIQRPASCACGGTCPRCRGRARQPAARLAGGRTLTISEPGDTFEQEADRIADEVMRLPGPRAEARPAPPAVQRKCGACAEADKKPTLQAKHPPSDPVLASAA